MKDTIVQTVLSVAEKYPKRKALLYKRNNKYVAIKYKQLSRLIQHAGFGFAQLGLEKGDRVAILSHNCPEWAIADLGAQYIGAITVPVHSTLSPKIIKYILQHSGARVLVVAGIPQAEKILPIQEELLDLKKIIVIDNDAAQSMGENTLSWDAFLHAGKKSKLKKSVELTYQDVASIVYTSGTTGLPKGVVLTHHNFLSNIAAATQYIPVAPTDIFLSFLPLSHIFERTAGYYIPLCKGAAIAYAQDFKSLKKNMQEIRPTILISVPRVFEKMYSVIWTKVYASKPLKKKLFIWAVKQKPNTWQYKVADLLVFKKIRKSLGGKLRLTISGGASLNEKLAKFFYKIGITILEGYGLTETASIVSVNKESKIKFGSVGIALQGVEVKIAPDKEILVRGPNVMMGYYRDEEVEEKPFDPTVWFHTGDLGFIDMEGFLFIIGRKKEMIVTAGGKNIWPGVIENALNHHTLINQSMVIGSGRRYLTALIVLNKKTEREVVKKIIDKMTEHFADFEKIVDFAILDNELSQENDELTPTLKLRREVIAKRYEKIIEKMYN